MQDFLVITMFCVVLVMEFGLREYTVSESSGFAEVVIITSGGSSTIPINVTVTPIELSATGKQHNINVIN